MFVDETRAAVEFVVVTVDYGCQKRLEIAYEKKRQIVLFSLGTKFHLVFFWVAGVGIDHLLRVVTKTIGYVVIEHTFTRKRLQTAVAYVCFFHSLSPSRNKSRHVRNPDVMSLVVVVAVQQEQVYVMLPVKFGTEVFDRKITRLRVLV